MKADEFNHGETPGGLHGSFENFEPAMPEGSWERLQARRKRRKRLIFWWLPALLVAGFFAGSLFWPNPMPKETGNTLVQSKDITEKIGPKPSDQEETTFKKDELPMAVRETEKGGKPDANEHRRHTENGGNLVVNSLKKSVNNQDISQHHAIKTKTESGIAKQEKLVPYSAEHQVQNASMAISTPAGKTTFTGLENTIQTENSQTRSTTRKGPLQKTANRLELSSILNSAEPEPAKSSTKNAEPSSQLKEQPNLDTTVPAAPSVSNIILQPIKADSTAKTLSPTLVDSIQISQKKDSANPAMAPKRKWALFFGGGLSSVTEAITLPTINHKDNQAMVARLLKADPQLGLYAKAGVVIPIWKKINISPVAAINLLYRKLQYSVAPGAGAQVLLTKTEDGISGAPIMPTQQRDYATWYTQATAGLELSYMATGKIMIMSGFGYLVAIANKPESPKPSSVAYSVGLSYCFVPGWWMEAHAMGFDSKGTIVPEMGSFGKANTKNFMINLGLIRKLNP